MGREKITQNIFFGKLDKKITPIGGKKKKLHPQTWREKKKSPPNPTSNTPRKSNGASLSHMVKGLQ